MSLFATVVGFFLQLRRYVGLRNACRNENENCLSVLTVEVIVKHVLLNVAVGFKFQKSCIV